MAHNKHNKASEMVTEKVLTAVDLVEYQEGSIVSRVIVEKDTGSVTLFAFDEGEGLSEHTTPYDALVHVLDGSLEVVIEGNPYTVSSGQIIIMPRNKPHALKALLRTTMMLTMIRS